MKVELKGKAFDAVKKIAQSMVDAGLKDVNPPVWMPGETVAVANRADAQVNDEFKSVVFNNFPKELAVLNNKPLKLRGTGPIIRISVANAVRDWDGELNGKKYSIKKGDQSIRCFS